MEAFQSGLGFRAFVKGFKGLGLLFLGFEGFKAFFEGFKGLWLLSFGVRV